MKIIELREAGEILLMLVEALRRGERVVIVEAGKSVAELKPAVRRFGVLRGRVRLPHDFDAPLPSDLIAAFEGGGSGEHR